MATIRLPTDFSEFLRLLNENQVEYLLVGGYAVNYYGYSRGTGDIDVWVHATPENAWRVCKALADFGFAGPEVTPALFESPGDMIRIGMPPLRIELLTEVSGVSFPECYRARAVARLDDLEVPLISRADLIANKRAAGRHKDLDDLEHLP